MELYKNIIHGVNITTFGFKPVNEQWRKFLTFAYQKSCNGNIKDVFVRAEYVEHGILYHVSYTVLTSEDYLVSDAEIDAIKPEDSP